MGLALVAGGAWQDAAVLGAGMLGIQFAIGAANDWFDVEVDALSKPAKPIPAGRVTRRTAAVVGLLAGGAGLLAAALAGAVALLLATVMLGAGLAYDAFLKRRGLGWLAFAIAFPMLPLYAWYGAVAALPPRSELLVPVAALAGPTLQLANGLVDLERDAVAGVSGLAGQLGRRRAWVVMAALTGLIYAAAWLSLASLATSALAPVVVTTATVTAALGVLASRSDIESRREWGWRLQAVGLACLAAGWLLAA